MSTFKLLLLIPNMFPDILKTLSIVEAVDAILHRYFRAIADKCGRGEQQTRSTTCCFNEKKRHLNYFLQRIFLNSLHQTTSQTLMTSSHGIF